MDRRNKDRHNLQLVFLAKAGTAYTAPFEGVTENMSRDGMLLRWLDSVPLPELGSVLNVEVELPVSEFGPRVMRCATTVVRITGTRNPAKTAPLVGLRIEGVRFRRSSKAVRPSLLEMVPISESVS